MKCPRCSGRTYIRNECIACGYSQEAERERQATPLPIAYQQRKYVPLPHENQGGLFR